MGRPFWDISLSLSFSFFLSSSLTLHFTSLHKEPEGQKDWTSSKQHRRQKKSFARITPTVFENRTNWHNNSAKWTRTTMDTRGLRNSRRKTQAYGVNDQWRQSLNFQKLLQGTDCKTSPAPILRQPGSERTSALWRTYTSESLILKITYLARAAIGHTSF